MATAAELRNGARSLSETVQHRRADMTAVTVRAKRFAVLGTDNVAQLYLLVAEADALLVAQPTVEWLTRGATAIGI